MDNINAAKEIVEAARILARGRESVESLMALSDFSIDFNRKVLNVYGTSTKDGDELSEKFEDLKVEAERILDEMQDLMDMVR